MYFEDWGTLEKCQVQIVSHNWLQWQCNLLTSNEYSHSLQITSMLPGVYTLTPLWETHGSLYPIPFQRFFPSCSAICSLQASSDFFKLNSNLSPYVLKAFFYLKSNFQKSVWKIKPEVRNLTILLWILGLHTYLPLTLPKVPMPSVSPSL